MADIEARIAQLLGAARATEKELARLKAKAAASAGADLASSAIDVKGAKVLAAALDGADAKALRETMDKLKDKLKSAAIVLGSVADGKVTLIAGVTSDLTGKVKAGELVNHVAQQVGGKGGGRPDMAQAGGTDPAGLPAALQSVRAFVEDGRLLAGGGGRGAGGFRRGPLWGGGGGCSYLGRGGGGEGSRRNSPATITRASVRKPGPRCRPPIRVTRRATGATTGPRLRPMPFAPRSRPIAPVYFVFNGTAANALALSAICRSTDAMVCHAMAHINVDECGAPEFFSGGAKLLTVDTPHAKLPPDAIAGGRDHAA